MHKVIDCDDVVIRFAGDSGDGMQLTGSLFANMSAVYGNGISTMPDYPPEIRAPKGTVAGVSGFQVHIGNHKITNPGDLCDLLVAMNPAALKASARLLKRTAMVLVDEDTFDSASMEKAGFTTDNPFTELGIEDRTIIVAPITTLTEKSLENSGLDRTAILKCKNMFTLGMACYIYSRELDYVYKYIESKFAKKHPEMVEPNRKVVSDGFNYAAAIQAIPNTYHIAPASPEKGLWRNITGNQAIAWGLIAAAQKAGLKLFCGSYPITPATSILEELALHKNLGVITMQTEDEISGICTAIGAAFAGNLAVTTTSGPGLSLMSEALGLAVMTELPLVVVDVQRGGPCTGLPTKTEQSDLMEALYGRNGESPVVVVAAQSPSGCFDAAFNAARIALERMTPVILLSEGYLGNGSEPWRIPSMDEYPDIHPNFAKLSEGKFQPYLRNAETMSRAWAVPGKKGLEHRVGGLEKDHAGVLSIDPANHGLMVAERAAKVEKVADMLPELSVDGPASGKLLVVGWGGTYGHISSAVEQLRREGCELSYVHFTSIKPLPRGTAEVFSHFDRILVAELNSGQFCAYLRSAVPGHDYRSFGIAEGRSFKVGELIQAIREEL